MKPSDQAASQVSQVFNQIARFLDRLPDEVSHFFSEYRRPLTVLGLIVAALVSLVVLQATLDAIHSIPLLSPTFQLVGLGYIIWFVWRYLLQSQNRDELAVISDRVKKQVFGKKTPTNVSE
ncbi:MAG: CAAD domain-containing protein [Jaaginema sp. PMC 1079.18]|nr:CAAD domain-containing protein [Jaaginema sp. PMC 1079.18]